MSDVVGHYERKQLLSSSRIIRWSHSRRFQVAKQYVTRLGGRTLLDYGCGDGTFLKQVHGIVDRCLASDVTPTDLSSLGNVDFALPSELGPSHAGRYDLVFCMEVLEHCPARQADQVLSDLRRLVSPQGVVIISVPVEIGPTLLGKQAMRRILGLRNVGEYRWNDRHALGDLLKMVFADDETAIERPAYSKGDHTWHTHFGFNWRALRKRLATDFVIADEQFFLDARTCEQSGVAGLPPALKSRSGR